MATWQYDLSLIPCSKVLEQYGSVPQNIEYEDFNRVKWWEGGSLPSNILTTLDTFFPRITHWHKNTQGWGREDSDFIEITFTNEDLSDIFIRIDVRNINLNFLKKITELAKNCNCFLVSMEWLKIITPNVSLLLEDIKDSAANRFAKNPDEFFDELARSKTLH
ncbi:MAG: hypothetical protein JST84_12895 [Acidobacteria bacterium]|nr:hypothetical protein [Acidobacteriota bacterium]